MTTAPAPANSPYGGGTRILPTAECIDISGGIGEAWEMGVHAGYNDPKTFESVLQMGVGPYFKTHNPSRYYNQNNNSTERIIDLCYTNPGSLIYQSESCVVARQQGKLEWNDVRSPFKGTVRPLDFTGIGLFNITNTSKWFTNVFGGDLRPDKADPSNDVVIEQFFAANTNVGGLSSTVFPIRDYDAHGVHAPN